MTQAKISKCPCGDIAIGYIIIPITNVYSSLRQVNEEQPVCAYHAGKCGLPFHFLKQWHNLKYQSKKWKSYLFYLYFW